MDDDDFWSKQLICAPEHENHNLFHLDCLINGKVGSFIIDSGSCTNVFNFSLADSLNLQTHKHRHPYKLSWSNDDGIWVRKQ